MKYYSATDWYDIYLSDRPQVMGMDLLERGKRHCYSPRSIKYARNGNIFYRGERLGRVVHVWELRNEQPWKIFDVTSWAEDHPAEQYYVAIVKHRPKLSVPRFEGYFEVIYPDGEIRRGAKYSQKCCVGQYPDSEISFDSRFIKSVIKRK